MSNKKYVFVIVVLLAFVVAPHVMAQGFVPLAPIPGLTGEGDVSATTEGLPAFFNNLYKFLIGLAAVAAVFQIIRSGIELALNQGSVSEIISSKGRVMQAIYGLALVLMPALVFGIINPNILNLSVSLKPITYTERPLSATTTPVIRDGCDIRSFGEFVEVALCPQGLGTSYTCQNGGERKVLFSGTQNAMLEQGVQAVGDEPVSCSKKVVITAHDANLLANFASLVVDLSSIVPVDKPTFQKFKSECTRARGKFIFAEHFLSSPFDGNCRPETGLNSAELGERRCFKATLSCEHENNL